MGFEHAYSINVCLVYTEGCIIPLSSEVNGQSMVATVVLIILLQLYIMFIKNFCLVRNIIMAIFMMKCDRVSLFNMVNSCLQIKKTLSESCFKINTIHQSIISLSFYYTIVQRRLLKLFLELWGAMSVPCMSIV